MLDLLLRIPAFIVSFLWALFFPARPQSVPPRPAPAPDPNAPSAASIGDGHEVSDAQPKVIGLFVLGLFVGTFIIMGALAWMYSSLYTAEKAIPGNQLRAHFQNAPLAKTPIERDWEAINADAHERLETYGWADKAHGVARIPIARAMELIAREGLPARAGQPPPFPAPAEEKLPLMELETTPNATKLHSE